MDYKEKYEELVEAARAIVEGNPGLCNMNKRLSRVRDLLPEKESEDERIRKSLVDYFRKFNLQDMWDEMFSFGDVISYLEKQKEQPTNEEMLRTLRVEYEKGVADTIAKYEQKEPLPVPDKFSGLKSLMLQYLQSAANRKDDTEIESDTDLWGRKILDYVWKHDEKPKEQRPAEWSEEDEAKKERLISIVKRALHGNEYPILNDNGATELITWLKSLRPQPKVDLDAIAKREYARGKQDGYWEGYKKAQENMPLHYGFTTFQPINRSCLEGGPCTNPQMDCINCPRRNGNGAYTTSPNTASGESKLEAH